MTSNVSMAGVLYTNASVCVYVVSTMRSQGNSKANNSFFQRKEKGAARWDSNPRHSAL